jgi:hypothetical protein
MGDTSDGCGWVVSGTKREGCRPTHSRRHQFRRATLTYSRHHDELLNRKFPGLGLRHEDIDWRNWNCISFFCTGQRGSDHQSQIDPNVGIGPTARLCFRPAHAGVIVGVWAGYERGVGQRRHSDGHHRIAGVMVCHAMAWHCLRAKRRSSSTRGLASCGPAIICTNVPAARITSGVACRRISDFARGGGSTPAWTAVPLALLYGRCGGLMAWGGAVTPCAICWFVAYLMAWRHRFRRRHLARLRRNRR